MASDGTKLSLRGLLHYLWDQAALTRWHPGFAGKRTWATVRRHLLLAAQHKITRGTDLQTRLYIPEPFCVEQRDAISARRLARWANAMSRPGKPKQLMLLIAEVKEIVPARYGYKAVVKHVPDQAFAMDDRLYQRLSRRFGGELALWGASDAVHMVMISTISVSEAGVPTILELSLMPVTAQWLPIENVFELQLIETLVHEGRAFARGLRYGLPLARTFASAILTDMSAPPCPLYVLSQPGATDEARLMLHESPQSWVWRTSCGEMPPLPTKQGRIASSTTPPSA